MYLDMHLYEHALLNSYSAINIEVYQMVEHSFIPLSNICTYLSQTNGKRSTVLDLVDISLVEIPELPIDNWTEQRVILQKYQSMKKRAYGPDNQWICHCTGSRDSIFSL